MTLAIRISFTFYVALTISFHRVQQSIQHRTVHQDDDGVDFDEAEDSSSD